MKRYAALAGLLLLTGCMLIKLPPSSRWIETVQYRALLHDRIGSEKPWVVLDAGHGGKNKGAHYHGVEEKHVVKDITLRAAEYLKARHVFVVLTREDDTYWSLPERMWIANKVRADLFVSIHANSAPNEKANGIEAYYAATVPEKAQLDFSTLKEDDGDAGKFAVHPALKNEMLVNPITPEKIEASRHLAELICSSIARKIKGVQNRGAKAADFFVLRWAPMPSVLVEVGFLSEETERRKLNTAGYRQKMAEAIAEGILKSLQNAGKFQ